MSEAVSWDDLWANAQPLRCQRCWVEPATHEVDSLEDHSRCCRCCLLDVIEDMGDSVIVRKLDDRQNPPRG